MASLAELALCALPNRIRHDKFLALAAPLSWTDSPKEALFKALKSCQELDWQEYLKRYPDLAAVKVDPIWHFVTFGASEGRQLFAKSVSPRVSIIVPNFNNSFFLDKCISSIVSQTEKNIEIIIVDDCSTDNSRQKIKSWQNRDSRIKLIAHSKNLGTHMARKNGVAVATGDIIMFVDADDFLTPNACDKVVNRIEHGFDICCFGMTLIDHGRMSPGKIRWYDNYFNSLTPREYTKSELLSASFIKRSAPRNIWSAAYKRDVAQKAFATLADKYLIFAEDLYEYLALVNQSQYIIKIPDRLYNYSFNVGITTLNNPGILLKNIRDRAEIIGLVQAWCNKNGLESVYKGIKEHLSEASFQSLVHLNPKDGPEFFRLLVVQYGPLQTSLKLREYFERRWDEISVRLPSARPREVKRIGIYYFRAKGGGIETTMRNMLAPLKAAGYEVIFFLERMDESDTELDNEIRYIAPSGGDSGAPARHLTSLHQAVKAAHIDLMIHMWMHDAAFFWDNLLLNLMNVPVITSLRFDHNMELLYRGCAYPHKSCLNALRTVAKIFCLTRSSELYLRSQGIDAEYIPNTPRLNSLRIPSKPDGKVIGFIGRLHDDKKQILQSQYILAEILKELPDSRILYIGGFEQSKKEDLFWERVYRFGLERNVEVTGWTDNPAIYFDRCHVLLYTSFIEGFPNGIAEAQARGLPVIMYDLDIEMANENPSIIRIPQGDVKGAAASLVSLLKNQPLRNRLSEIALLKSGEYNMDRFGLDIIRLVSAYGKSSTYLPYSRKEYQVAIRSMAFYAGKGFPQF